MFAYFVSAYKNQVNGFTVFIFTEQKKKKSVDSLTDKHKKYTFLFIWSYALFMH